MEKSPVKYSQVVTCYYEEKSIEEFYTRSKKVWESIGEPYEMIFINDGSTDGTYAELCRIFEQDPNVTCIIDFTRNYGQGEATTAGMEAARGEYVVCLDSDLQLDPEDIPRLIEKKDEGAALIRGYRAGRKDSVFRRSCAWLVNRVSARSLKVTDLGCSYMLVSNAVLRQFGYNRWQPWGKGRFFKHFNRIVEVPVNHHDRRYGKSGQPFIRLWRFNIQLLLNASEMLFQYIALAAVVMAALFFVRVLMAFVSSGSILPVITNGLILNAVAIVFFVLLGMLCLIGEFIVRLYAKSERHPAYIIREMKVKDSASIA